MIQELFSRKPLPIRNMGFLQDGSRVHWGSIKGGWAINSTWCITWCTRWTQFIQSAQRPRCFTVPPPSWSVLTAEHDQGRWTGNFTYHEDMQPTLIGVFFFRETSLASWDPPNQIIYWKIIENGPVHFGIPGCLLNRRLSIFCVGLSLAVVIGHVLACVLIGFQ